MPEFKDMLKYFRMKENLSQSELAAKLGISASADFFQTDLNTLRGRENEAEQQPSYYLDKDSSDAAQFLFSNPEYKVLFDASRKVKPEDINLVAEMIKRMAGSSSDDDAC